MRPTLSVYHHDRVGLSRLETVELTISGIICADHFYGPGS